MAVDAVNVMSVELEEPVGRPGSPEYALDEVLIGIGQRIRRYRRLRDMTLQDLSAVTGLSPSMLSTLERGQTGVSVASIHAIARALDVSITSLFKADGPGDPVIKSLDQRQEVTSGGALRTLAITDPEMRLEFYVYDFAPGDASANTPSIHGGMEYGINLTGTLDVDVDGQRHTLHPGDAIQYSTKTPHLMTNRGDRPVRAVWVNISRI